MLRVVESRTRISDLVPSSRLTALVVVFTTELEWRICRWFFSSIVYFCHWLSRRPGRRILVETATTTPPPTLCTYGALASVVVTARWCYGLVLFAAQAPWVNRIGTGLVANPSVVYSGE